MREYLEREWERNPPFEIDLEAYREGASRAPYKVPWEDIGERIRALHRRERRLREARVGMARYTTALNRHGHVRGRPEADWRKLVHIDRRSAIVLRGNPKAVVFNDQEVPSFIYLTEEVGDLLRRQAQPPCRIYLNHLDRSMPLWYISQAPKQSASEQWLCPLQHKAGNVRAQSWVLGKEGDALIRYVDRTWRLGDLYYVRNLTAVLASHAQ